MREQHVEVPLVHRDVGRLADRAARVVHPLRRIGELHEVAEVLDRRIAPTVLHVPHEGRPVNRRQHETFSADCHVALRVARVLHVLPRRSGAETAREPPRQVHPVAAHVGARVPPELQRLGILGEAHPDLLEHRLGIRLDQRQPLLVEDLVVRDPPLDERRRLDPHRRALRPPRRPASPAPPAAGHCFGGFAHDRGSLRQNASPASSPSGVAGKRVSVVGGFRPRHRGACTTWCSRRSFFDAARSNSRRCRRRRRSAGAGPMARS